jgi:hypothetical protein
MSKLLDTNISSSPSSSSSSSSSTSPSSSSCLERMSRAHRSLKDYCATLTHTHTHTHTHYNLDVPTFTTKCLHVPWRESPHWWKVSGYFAENGDFHVANLRHGTDGFTSPLKEGALRTFSPLKSRSGLNSRTWVPKASMLTTRPPKPLH